jgi:Rrf2 family transcriptional regulator, nitric oxide-sensitive transcriptional repressor
VVLTYISRASLKTFMQLTTHTDFALRVLVYLAQQQNRLTTISELAEFYNISRNHLVKVVHNLGLKGFIKTTRGKNGGICLAKPPQEIVIGEVVSAFESNFYLVECLNPHKQGQCSIQLQCGLSGVFDNALKHYMSVLNNATLQDAILLKPNFAT